MNRMKPMASTAARRKVILFVLCRDLDIAILTGKWRPTGHLVGYFEQGAPKEQRVLPSFKVEEKCRLSRTVSVCEQSTASCHHHVIQGRKGRA